MPDEYAEVDVDLGEEAPEDKEIVLEKKYREQMRQIMPQKIELPISTLPQMIEHQINLNPEFQRRGRWDQERRSRFIESLIMNVPIPPVFLGEDDYGAYVVLDGRQRLTAINEFLKNIYPLKGLKVWAELNGKTFDELQKRKLDRFLTRRFVPAVVILKESSPQVKYDVFDRLNTGGVIATPMEIRNALFQGEFTTLLRTLSSHQTFRRLWGIPLDKAEREKNTTYSRMLDLELVLRFFALQYPEQMTLQFSDHLSEFMERRNTEHSANAALLEQDKNCFEDAVRNAWHILGEHAFQKSQATEQPPRRRSAPLADAIMIGLADLDPKDLSDALAEKLRQAIHRLLREDDDFLKAISTGTNGKGAIRVRIGKIRETVKKVAGEPN